MTPISSLLRRHSLKLCAAIGACGLFTACHDDYYHHRVYHDYDHRGYYHDRHYYDRGYYGPRYGPSVYVAPTTRHSGVVVTPGVTVRRAHSYYYY